MNTDIDRLHDVFDRKLYGRGCGKTFAQCHNVAGAIELGYRHIFIIVTMLRDINYILPMLQKVFDDHGLPIRNYSRNRLKAGESEIVFLTDNEHTEDKMRGIDGFVVYMKHWD